MSKIQKRQLNFGKKTRTCVMAHAFGKYPYKKLKQKLEKQFSETSS